MQRCGLCIAVLSGVADCGQGGVGYVWCWWNKAACRS
jgi:hypothetical protein